MKTTSEQLIEDLIERIRQHLNATEKFKMLSDSYLNKRPAPESWSVLECIEHLNLYGDFYLPEIGKRIRNSRYPAEHNFKSGWLGNYFANSMLPKEKLNKMKTFKDKNPIGSRLDRKTLDRFTNQQHQMLKLLEQARNISLNRTRTAISISNLIRLKLGDTFRFVVYHNQRHIVQAEKAVS